MVGFYYIENCFCKVKNINYNFYCLYYFYNLMNYHKNKL